MCFYSVSLLTSFFFDTIKATEQPAGRCNQLFINIGPASSTWLLELVGALGVLSYHSSPKEDKPSSVAEHQGATRWDEISGHDNELKLSGNIQQQVGGGLGVGKVDGKGDMDLNEFPSHTISTCFVLS